MLITTPRLCLRHFIVADAQRVRALNAEPSTAAQLPSHLYATPADADAALAYLVACYARPGGPLQQPYVLAVERAIDGELLGHVGFSPYEDSVEVSYAIAESARGYGYGVEALTHACRWVVAKYDVAPVLAITASENAASIRTLERASFVFERHEVKRFQGTVRPVVRYRWPA